MHWYENITKNKCKNYFKKYLFKLMKNAVFRKTMENVRNHKDIKLVITKGRRNYFVSEPDYNATKKLSENLLVLEKKKHKYLWIP